MADSSRFERAAAIFEAALDHPAATRAAFLAQACGDDADLRAEVESLLEHDTRAGDDFLASPVVALRHEEADEPAWALALIGRKIGHYTIRRLVGRGGMGCVFEALQERPARTVALKVLQPGLSTPSALARFRLEPEVLGRLQHPNIAQVFEAGVHEDKTGVVPYFAMEFIPDAQPLLEYADAHELNTRQRLELFIKVCDAIHHGHQKGIIHRDIKPGNILVGADGEPKVIDFGVARASDADIVLTTQCTHVGDLVGTVHYMSPEQCDGNPAAIDTRSDIYSLGVVLYELLTGATPYDMSGTTVFGAMRVIKERSPRRPSTVVGSDGRPARHLRGDIDVVLLKALEKERSRRYASVAEFGADLRRILEQRPIQARPPNLLYLLGKAVRRNPWKSAAAAAAIVGLIASLATLLTMRSLQAEREHLKEEAELRRMAELARDEAARSRHEAEVARYGASISAAETALLSGDPAMARFLLDDPSHAALRGWEWRHLRQRVDQSLRVVAGFQTPIDAAAIDPSGRHVAMFTVVQRQSRVHVWRLDDEAAKPYQLGVFDAGGGLAFSRDGALLAVAAKEGAVTVFTIYRLDSEPFELLARWEAGSHPIRAMAFSPTAPLVLATAIDERAELVLWDLAEMSAGRSTPRELCRVPGQAITKAAIFSPDGAYLAAAGDDWTIQLFDVDRLRRNAPDPLRAVLRGHTYYVCDVAFSPDGRWLASASIDQTVRIWDVVGCLEQAADSPGRTALGPGAEVAVLRGHTEGVRAVAFDPDGCYLVSGGVDRLIRMWDHDRFVTGATADPAGAAAGAAQWQAPVHEQICTLRGHEAGIIRLGVTPAGEIISVSTDGSVRSWLPGTQDVVRLRGHGTSVGHVSFSPDGRFLISADLGYAVIVWDLRRRVPRAARQLRYLECTEDLACWNFNGRTMLALATIREKRWDAQGSGGRIVLWELTDDRDDVGLGAVPIELLAPPQFMGRWDASVSGLPEGASGFASLAVSRDGRRLVAAHTTGNLCVWEFGADGQSPHLVTTFPGPGPGRACVAFLDEAGHWVAAACPWPSDPAAPTEVIRVWDAVAGVELPESPYAGHHSGAVLSLAVDGGYNLLASASSDTTVGLWWIDRSQGAPTLEWRTALRGHADMVHCLAFHPSPAEHRLASGSWDRTIRIWDTTTGAALATLHGHAGPVRGLAFDPQGETLASASAGMLGSDNVVRIWDAAEEHADPATRRERAVFLDARRRVLDAVRDTMLDFDAALGHLVGWSPQTVWGRQVRALVLERFDQFVTRADHILEYTLRVVTVPDLPIDKYRAVLRWARLGARLAPEDPRLLFVCGALEYRSGQFEAALHTLAAADALTVHTRLDDETRISMRLYLAMTRAALGDHDAARAELREARRAYDEMRGKTGTDNAALARLLSEAEQRVRPAAGQ